MTVTTQTQTRGDEVVSKAAVRPRRRSFLDLLSDDAKKAFLSAAATRSYGAGERIVRRDDAVGAGRLDEIAIVLEGAVTLLTRDHRQAHAGEVLAGDAIELKAVLQDADDWQFNWVSAKLATIASVPRKALAELAERDPVLHRYIERTTCYGEIDRLARDLRLFEMSAAHVRRVVGALEPLDVATRIDLRVNGPHFAVVRRGEIEVDLRDKVEGADDVLARYTAGEYFILGLDDVLDYDSSAETSIWTLSREAWGKLDGASQAAIERLFRFADPRLRAAAPPKDDAHLAAEAPKAAPKKEEEDEGPAISDFAADVETLKRLHKKKRPFVEQLDEMDCGAACLSMVSRFFGRKIDVPTWRSLVHVTRDGASLFSLKKAAEHVGFEAIGIKTEYHALAKYLVPMIVLCEYHFVVVYAATPQEITVGDPGRGVLTMPAADFKREWSGVALLLKPTPRLDEFPETAPTYWKYLEVLRGLRGLMAEALLASVVGFVLGLVPPLFMQFIFDKVLPAQNRSLLDLAALGVMAITVLRCLIDWARSYLLMYIASRADAKFAVQFLARTFELPLSFFAVRRVGAITSRLNELTRIRSFLTDQTLWMLISLMSAVIYAIILGIYNPLLLLVVLVTTPMSLLFIRVVGPKLKRILQEIFKVESRGQGMAFEHFSSFETIKSIHGSVAARWRWEALFSRLLDLRRQSIRMTAFVGSISSVFDGVTSVAVLLTSVWLFTRREFTLGQVVATNVLVGSVTAPISSLIAQWESFTQIGVSFARIDDVLTSAPEKNGTEDPQLTGRIDFENVYFQYGSELSPMALRGVTLSIQPGETVAFVGASGSGKTTLGYMVNLLYAPTRGRVLLDGVDATAMQLASLREQVAMITQDNSIFSGSILDTIALGDPHPSFERALEAAKAADAHDFINKTKHNYSTELGESGSGLSGGQRQRLNIARALYRNPAILIMDEATSSLDAVSERKVMENIRKSQRRRTTIVIAHRLNTIMSVDRIYVFDQGKVVESGTHAELTELQGHYYRLFKKQMSMS
jgi:ATP-binding cassette subfamily B protein